MNEIARNNAQLALSLPTIGQLSDVALVLPENLPVEQWREAGLQIGRMRGATQWWVGDWWAFGEHRYGERKALVESDEWEGPAFQTCANAATVCQAIATSRRREVLSFNHHAEVASLPIEWQDQLLDEAEQTDTETGRRMSIAALRQRVKEVRAFLSQGWTPDQLERKKSAEEGGTVVANLRNGEDGQPIERALLNWADAEGRLERIDRQTEWGNPFVLDADGDRETVIENYGWYLDKKPSLLKKVPALRGKVLACWCYPEACHGDIICERIGEMESQ